jgi:cysteine synthase A
MENPYMQDKRMRRMTLFPRICIGLRIDAFVDFVGSGGTFAGVASALRATLPGVRCYVVEPAGAAVLAAVAAGETEEAAGRLMAPHKIQGGGYSMPALRQLGEGCAPPDGYLTVDSEEATEMTRLLARHEGVFSGFSGGANVAAAVRRRSYRPYGLKTDL